MKVLVLSHMCTLGDLISGYIFWDGESRRVKPVELALYFIENCRLSTQEAVY